MKYDYIVVGAGLFGATFANEASHKGRRVLVVDRRPHVAGNAYTEKIEGINVHKYGAHVFHTNYHNVWKYINFFADFNNFVNSPVASFHGKLFSLPFNMWTYNQMWGICTPQEVKDKIASQRAEIKGEPKNLEEQAISLVGRDIYETLVKGYTEKRWGRKCCDLPAFIINNIPVRFVYCNDYYDCAYQGVPIGGYTDLVENMLRKCDVELECDYLKDRDKFNAMADKIVFSGSIDEYFDYCYGALEYRSARFETEVLDTINFQGNAVVNYTDAETPFTRVIEHKWFEFGMDERGRQLKKTVVSREFSKEWKQGEERCYAVNDEQNAALYLKYKALADKEKNVIFGGRLAEYKNYGMDQAISSARDKWCREIYGI